MSHSNSTFNAVPPSVIKEEKKSDTEIKKEFDKLLLPKTHREAQNFFTANKVILHKIINGNPTFYIEKAIKTGAGMMEKLLEIDSVQKTLTQQTDLIVQMINKNLISPVSALFTSIKKETPNLLKSSTMEPVVRTIIDRYFHTSQSKQFSALSIILENNPYLLLHLENQKISESDSFIVSKDDEHHSKNGYSPLVTRVYKHSQNNKVMFYGRCADGEYKHLPMEGCYMHFMSVLPPKEENRLSDSYGCDPFSGYEDSYLCVEEKREGKKDTKKSTLRLYYVNEERSCIPIDIPEEKISEFTKQIEELRISEFNKHAEEIRRSSPLANYHIINKIQLDNNQITQVIVKATGHTPSNLDLFSHIQFGKSNNNLESALEGVPSTKRREVLSRILTKIREIHWPYDNYLEKCKAMVEKSFGQMSGHEENRKIILEKVNTAENRFKLIRMLAFLVRIFKANESSLLLNSTLDLGKQVFEMLGEQGGTRQKLEPVAGKVESVKGLSLFKLATQPSYIPSPSPKETKLPEEKVQADKKRKLSSISSS